MHTLYRSSFAEKGGNAIMISKTFFNLFASNCKKIAIFAAEI